MKFRFLSSVRVFVAGAAALSCVACAASRSRSQHDFQARQSAGAVERMQELQRRDTLVASSRDRETAAVYESRVETYEAVAAQRAVLAVPLAEAALLPPGAVFARCEGGLAVAVRCRGDTLIVEARSDSMQRAVTRVERRETRSRRQCDSVASAVQETRLRCSVDSLARSEVRIVGERTRAAPAARRGWWFAAGAAVCALLLVGLCRLAK